MYAIINIDDTIIEKKKLFLLEENPLNIKVAGKSILEYYCDLLNELKIKKVFLQGQIFEGLLEELKALSLNKFEVEYTNERDLEKFYSSNFKKFCLKRLIIIKGLGFLFDSYGVLKEKLSHKGNIKIENKSFSLYHIKNHKKVVFSEFPNFADTFSLKELTSLIDFMEINYKLLDSNLKQDFLSGYSNNKNIILGKNVNIHKSCEIIAPVMILDNVNIEENCTIGPNVIINSDVYIEKENEVKSSIVYDNTYISSKLNFEDKLICSNVLVDRFNQQVFYIDKKFISENKGLLSTLIK